MPPEHLYYQEINSKDGNYYRRWASVFGPSMSELIDRILKSSKHEEQAFNACAGILHRVKAIPKGIAEEAARKCIEMNSCRYSTYRQVLKKMECDEHLLVSSKKQKKINFFMKGEPLARFPMLLLYNFVFSLLLLIIPSSSLKVIKVPSDFNMLIIVYQHIINEIPDYFFIKLIQLTKLC